MEEWAESDLAWELADTLPGPNTGPEMDVKATLGNLYDLRHDRDTISGAVTIPLPDERYENLPGL